MAPVRRGAASIPSIEAHDAFDDEHIRARGSFAQERIEQRRRHGPAVEIEARSAGRGFMEGGVDIVGAGLGALHGKPAPMKRRKQGQGHGGLAGTGTRGGDDEAARRHRASRKRRR